LAAPPRPLVLPVLAQHLEQTRGEQRHGGILLHVLRSLLD
jgi:hypothetical protein